MATTAEPKSFHKQSKVEKRLKKTIATQGGVQVPNVEKVVLRVGPGTDFVISRPDVFKMPGTQALLVFGNAQIADNTSNMAQMLQSLEKSAGAAEESAPEPAKAVDAAAPAEITEENIELVMSASTKGREEAIEALKAKNGDVIEAIMALDGK